ncbi:MAG: hypothetical protein HONBIEJF_00306 [Fimbriimonadaceae bacterium]|nr:hypothetical protein [Fimbriimonadaceae bacterium]
MDSGQNRFVASQEMLMGALNKAASGFMITNLDLEIIYLNATLQSMLKGWEPEFQKVFGSGFHHDQLIGKVIDVFHKDPAHQRRVLGTLQGQPYQTQIKVGPYIIELTANALFSSTGEKEGYATEWLDVTERVLADQEYKAQVKEIADRMDFLRGACSTDLATALGALAEGELSLTIQPRTPLLDIPNQPDLALMAETFNNLRNQTVKAVEAYNSMFATLKDMVDVADEIAAGNLTVTVTPKSEADRLGNAFAKMISNLSEMISQTKVASDSIADASVEVMTGNDDLAQRTEEQAASLEETASSMEEMTSTVKQNADNAKQANQLAMQARESAEKGGQVVSSAVSTMEEINTASKRIADIISVIDEIAFQTNLLALNAAVEAARVGEQGRGFAVVAAEVRNLAGRSATAAKEIKALVQDSVQKVGEGSTLVNQSGSQLEEIVTSVKKVADIIAEISAAAQEQAAGIEQVNKAITQMDQITQQNAALVEQANAASQSMNSQASDLQNLISNFKIDSSVLNRLQAQIHAQREAKARESRKNGSIAGRSERSSRTESRTASGSTLRASADDLDNFEEF